MKIDKVVDCGIRKILKERLEKYDNDSAKAFSNLDENPIWLNQEKGIAIKSVTIDAGLSNPEPLRVKRDNKGNVIRNIEGIAIPSDYVQTSGNHHVAIFEDAEGHLQEHIVSYYEATARAILGIPVVDKDFNKEEGWNFKFTMKQNEYFVFPSDDFNPSEIDLTKEENYSLISKHLYRVQKLSSKYYVFRHHLETNVDDNNALKDKTWKRIQSLDKLKNVVKVRVNNIGKIVYVGEY